ncbi:hypothetical protein NLM31_21015 [Bradyrhizobium sp. CCGUVB4N]|uniref:hypothetical protein n=1 Tax=Bradyrhizobium sp. CCGUVB4N TaxID=2949631 RepID=UPI0020B43BAB|nr:hypothetical protein [Bradyrhizobium sp. CCGUVB4N]MCP3382851.1 hypothetical protein [Bradyrhizobium sp. CCGUVB4N]
MMGDIETISAGREAWNQLRNRHRDFDLWVSLGKAFAVGRAEAFKVAGVNQPFGPKYQAAIKDWLALNGFADVPFRERSSALRMIDSLPDIMRWRADLSSGRRLAWNSPGAVLKHWQRSLARPERPERPPIRVRPPVRDDRHGRLTYSQALVRRTRDALIETAEVRDVCVRATLILERVLPDRTALLEFFEERPRPQPNRRVAAAPKSDQVEAVA